jgi:hypothetical protein
VVLHTTDGVLVSVDSGVGVARRSGRCCQVARTVDVLAG